MEFVWSLNVAGLQGLWRLSHFVQSQPEGSRPAIICVQEAACNQRQLDGLGSVFGATWAITVLLASQETICQGVFPNEF